MRAGGVQDYPISHYEVIVIDDKSPDCQNDIIERYQYEFPNLKFIKHVENKRQGGARNTGLNNAVGEYVFFVDSDDYWIRRDVFKTFNDVIHNNPNYNIYESSIYITGEKPNYSDKNINQKIHCQILNLNEYYRIKPHPCIWNGCYKKQYIKNFPFREHVLYEDTDWKIKVYTNSNYIVSFDYKFYYYFQNPESSIHLKTTQMYLDHLNASIICRNEWKNSNLDQCLKDTIINSKNLYLYFVLLIRDYNIETAYFLLRELNKTNLYEEDIDKKNLLAYIASKLSYFFPFLTVTGICFATKIKRSLFKFLR